MCSPTSSSSHQQAHRHSLFAAVKNKNEKLWKLHVSAPLQRLTSSLLLRSSVRGGEEEEAAWQIAQTRTHKLQRWGSSGATRRGRRGCVAIRRWCWCRPSSTTRPSPPAPGRRLLLPSRFQKSLKPPLVCCFSRFKEI